MEDEREETGDLKAVISAINEAESDVKGPEEETVEGLEPDNDPENLLTEAALEDDTDTAAPSLLATPESQQKFIASLMGRFGLKAGAKLSSMDAARLAAFAAAEAAKRQKNAPAKTVRVTGRTSRPPRKIITQRREMFQAWRKRNPNLKPYVSSGFYYFNAPIKFTVEGTTTRAYLILDQTEVRFFDKAIDDTVTTIGGTYTYTIRDTNLRNPGRNVYPKQLFLIEGIELEERMLTIKYADAAITAASIPAAVQNGFKGIDAIWDDGLVIPDAIFRDQDGENNLLRALIATSALKFERKRYREGNASSQDDDYIDLLSRIDLHGKRKTGIQRETSGGGRTRNFLDRGYRWNLDQNNPDAGVFAAIIEPKGNFVFPCIPVDIGAGTAAKPESLEVWLTMTFSGTSIREAGSEPLDKQ